LTKKTEFKIINNKISIWAKTSKQRKEMVASRNVTKEATNLLETTTRTRAAIREIVTSRGKSF